MAHEPPLRPKLTAYKPPWHPCYKEYHGRPDWWTEHDYKDVLYRNGLDPLIYYKFKEQNPYWFDPKVPDGTSVTGPFGLDSQYHRNLTRKVDQPISLVEHQKQLRENSSQYRNIIAKWDISKEHPGIPVSMPPGTYDSGRTNNLGLYSDRQVPVWWYGPRFFDKPMNEGCLEKGLALAKYAAVPTLVWHFIQVKHEKSKLWQDPMPVSKYLKDWFVQRYLVSAMLSMTFGITACTAATIRETDDTWNWTIASIVTGAAHASLRNYSITRGLVTAFPLVVAGAYFQFFRTVDQGWQGLIRNKFYSGLNTNMTGPLDWKFFGFFDPSQTQLGQVPEKLDLIM